jgi:uncharacterized membrane protein YqjE
MDDRSFSTSQPISSIVREVLTSFSDLVRSEIRLAKAEVGYNVKDAGMKFGRAAAFGYLVFLGTFALLAALVIGLGSLMNGHYGWSALIVGLLMTGGGAFLAVQSIKKVAIDTSLPHTRNNLDQDKELLVGKIHDLSEVRNAARQDTA